MIYNVALDFSHPLSRTDKRTISSESRWDFDKPLESRRKTPGILLLNREVHYEATNKLYDKTFVLNRGCDPRILMEYFSKGFLQKLRRVKINVPLLDDPARFANDETWPNMFLLLYPVWQQAHSLHSLQVDLPILSRVHLFRNDIEYLEAYIALVVVPLNLLKKEINKTRRPTNVDYSEPYQPFGPPPKLRPDSQEAILAITLDCDLFQAGIEEEVRAVLGLATNRRVGNLEYFTERYPGWSYWWNSEKKPRSIKSTFGILAHRRDLGNR
jgi:hypothetical protein